MLKVPVGSYHETMEASMITSPKKQEREACR